MQNKNISSIVVIIPSLNPDENLLSTVEGIIGQGFTDIILVDDGSKQECQKYFDELARRTEIKVIHHEKNKGKGAALKTAFSYYINNYDLEKYKGVCTADADGQHLAEDIKKTSNVLIKENRKNNNRMLVLGTRDFNNPIVPFKSKNGNKITTEVFKVLYGKKINDTQTGLRAITNKYVKECLELKGERFEYEINMLIDAVKSHVEIIEETIATVYLNQNRETHFNPIKDSFKIYKVMFECFVKFSCVGVLSMILDQGLFAVLVNCIFTSLNIEKAITLATIFARICSSVFNYAMNKKVVFDSNCGKVSLVRYYILCIAQMFASAFLVTIVYIATKGNSSLLKLFVDLGLFFVSYRIQQKWVFKKETSYE